MKVEMGQDPYIPMRHVLLLAGLELMLDVLVV